MARRKSRLSRMLDLKPAAFATFRALTTPFPVTRHWLGFYPEIGSLPDRIESVSERLDYRIRLAEPKFQPQLAILAKDNWDVCRPMIRRQDPLVSERFVGIVQDAIVPGHTFVPVDPQTWRQIIFGQQGWSGWNLARPAPTALRSRRLREPAIAIPPHFNLWHVVIEYLLPLVQAARLEGWGDSPLFIITAKRRPPLIDAVVEGLCHVLGVDIRFLEVGPSEHVRVDRLLVAANQCWNVEHSYALAEAIPTLRGALEASYQGRERIGGGERVYITRRGSKLRQIVNENEVVEGLQQRGFAVIQGHWGNHHDQVAAFSAAKIVVGVHGAGLSNIIFSTPDTTVFELFPTNHRKTSMLHLSAEHDLSHHAFFGSEEGPNQAFSVDPKRLFESLDPLL